MFNYFEILYMRDFVCSELTCFFTYICLCCLLFKQKLRSCRQQQKLSLK